MPSSSRCVILVDDEQNILNSLKRELRDWAGKLDLEILTAISGRKGLELLAERGTEVFIVVSDLKMPEMKGSEFLLAARKSYPDIVTILLTGYSETEEIIKAVSAGIFSYMLKPWDSEYLISEMQKAYEYGEIKRQNAHYMKVMEEELRWAGEMQKAILKPSLPHCDGVEFRASYRPVPALYCGGDYYDVICMSPDRYLLLVGDVAGHGVRAAFVTGILKAVIYPEYVRAVIGKGFSPGAFLTWLNERINFELRSASGLIVTFFAGFLDMKARTLRYANAGQSHPVIVRDGKATALPVSGSGLGFANSVSYVEQVVIVRPDDVITLFTDGLIEPGVTEGKEPIKPATLFERVAYSPDYHRRLMEAALAESGRVDFDDDVTLVTARIL